MWDPDAKRKEVSLRVAQGCSSASVPFQSIMETRDTNDSICWLPKVMQQPQWELSSVVEGDNYPANEAHFPFSSPP